MTLQTTKDTQFLETQKDLKQAVIKGLKAKKINIPQTISFFQIFAIPKTQSELELFIELFSSEFSILDVIYEKQGNKQKTEKEQKIQGIISRLIKHNPLRAAQLAQKATAKNVDLEALKHEYPELNEL